METYDREKHILLRDVAHRRCIHQDGEFDRYVRELQASGLDVFTVNVSEWPQVKRTPLPIIIFSISVDGSGNGGSSMGGPTADMTWEGEHLAVERNWFNKRATWDMAKEMAPSRFEPAHRVAYAWQVAEFDPDEHVVIRYWCREHNVSIVNFWLGFYPQVEDELTIVETTNPELAGELARGSYSPTRRSMLRSQLYLARNYFLGTDEQPPDPAQPDGNSAPAPQPRAVHDSDEDDEEEVQWTIHQGSRAYEAHEVVAALEAAVGRNVRLFSGTTMDSQIVAISRESVARYLAGNDIDKRQYVRDSGGRNYDCDDFALSLRNALIRDHGYNCCAVIAGDVHAFNAFILAGDHGPEVAFVEPQTDGLVTELAGDYSVDRRCEVII